MLCWTRFAKFYRQNADGLRWGYSYTRSQFTKAIDVLKREAAIGFIPEHVESEFQDLAETIAKTLVFPGKRLTVPVIGNTQQPVRRNM